jgi:transcriptional regulator with XRE-family HTH domain
VTEQVGRRIAELRRERGETQAQLAERLEVSIKYLQRVERGVNLTIDSLVDLANNLDVQVRDLFDAPRGRPTPRRPGRPAGSGKKKARPRR